MRNRCLGILLCVATMSCNKTVPLGSTTYQYHKPEPGASAATQKSKIPANTKIYHDPDADFKQRRGQIHNRTYLKKKLATLHLNVDSLQDVAEYLNRDTKSKEWEYQISTVKGSAGQILRFYKSHNNADGSSGQTVYGDEKRRMPER